MMNHDSSLRPLPCTVPPKGALVQGPPASASSATGVFPAGFRRLLHLAVLGGAVLLAVGWTASPLRTWQSLLINGFYLTALSLSGALFVAIHFLSRAGWSTGIRRVPEAMAAVLPLGAVAVLTVLAGAGSLYHWSHPEAVAADPILAQKAAWLNLPAFGVRMAAYLAVWLGLTRWILSGSRRQDVDGDPAWTGRCRVASTVFVFVFAPTFSLAAVDWLMSLEPHWYSTLYPWYVFSGVLVNGVSVIAVLVVLLKRRGILPDVGERHLHDLGKYVFAFSFFWGYLWYSQYMLIWYANLPEEIPHYVVRSHGAWGVVFLVNVGVNLVLPFLVLLPGPWKRREGVLVTVCGLLIVGHWLDLYLLVVPAGSPEMPHVGILEAGLFLAAAAAFLLAFEAAFRGAAPVPVKDPYLEESLLLSRH